MAGTAMNGYAGTKPVQNILSFSESWSDKVDSWKDFEDVWNEKVSSGKYSVKATVSLAGVDITQFNEGTTFSLNLGGVNVYYTLGDDPAYHTAGIKKASTSATFVETALDEHDKTVVVCSVQLRWTADKLTVTVKGKCNPDFYGTAIAADGYDEQLSGLISDTLSGEIDFDTLVVYFDDLPIDGKIKTQDVTKGLDDFTLSSISLKGEGLGISE